MGRLVKPPGLCRYRRPHLLRILCKRYAHGDDPSSGRKVHDLLESKRMHPVGPHLLFKNLKPLHIVDGLVLPNGDGIGRYKLRIEIGGGDNPEPRRAARSSPGFSLMFTVHYSRLVSGCTYPAPPDNHRNRIFLLRRRPVRSWGVHRR